MRHTMTAKIRTVGRLARELAGWRSRGKRIVFTNGCFDILHAGHVDYLQRAARMGDVLVIGLNSDSSVRKLKGPSRPVNRQSDRARVLAALECVDRITIFAERTPERLIRKVRPDVLVKGADWKVEDIVGAEFVRNRGGKIVTVPFVKGYSTTGLLRKIASS